MPLAGHPLVVYRFPDSKVGNQLEQPLDSTDVERELLQPAVALPGWSSLHHAQVFAGCGPVRVPACAALDGSSCFGIDMVFRVGRGDPARMHLIDTQRAFLSLQRESGVGWRLCAGVVLSHAGARIAGWHMLVASQVLSEDRWVSVALVFTGDDLVLVQDGVVVARRVFRDAVLASPGAGLDAYELGWSRVDLRHGFHGAIAGLRLWDGVPVLYEQAIAAVELDGMGELHSKLEDLGDERGLLGDSSRPERIARIAGLSGRIREYEHGVLCWSRDTGARLVHGAIHAVYRSAAVRSRLGWPVSDEVAARCPGARVQRFQRGAIFWSPDTGAHPVYGPIFAHYMDLGGENSSLGLPVDGSRELEGGWFQDFQGGRIRHEPGVGTRALPGRGSASGLDTAEARDALPDAPEWLASGSARVELPDIPGWVGIPDFRRYGWWCFGNFRARKLSPVAYARTFEGAAPVDPERWAELVRSERWVSVFYDLAYRGVAAGGHGFGLAVAALHALQGRLRLPAPMQRLTPSKQLRAEIGLYQGYQLGAGVIDWFLASIGSGQAASPRAVFDEVERALHAHAPLVLCMYDVLHDRGYCMLAYGCARGVDGDHGRIYVVDPNLPWTSTQDPHPTYLRVLDDDTFLLAHQPRIRSQRVAGDLWPDTLVFAIPDHVLTERPRAPVDEIREELDFRLGGLILLAGDAEMHQVASDGRELYRKVGGRRYLVRDAIPGLLRVPRFDAARSSQIYAQRGPLPDRLDLHVRGTRARGGRFGLHLAAPRFDIHIEAPLGRAAIDRIALRGLRSAAPRVTVETSARSQMARVWIRLHRDQHGRPPRALGLDLPLAARSPAVVQVDARGGALRFRPAGPPRPVAVSLEVLAGTERRRAALRLLPAAAGEALRVWPRDWRAPDGDIVIERLEDLDGPITSRQVTRARIDV